VTGVQTCALPIFRGERGRRDEASVKTASRAWAPPRPAGMGPRGLGRGGATGPPRPRRARRSRNVRLGVGGQWAPQPAYTEDIWHALSQSGTSYRPNISFTRRTALSAVRPRYSATLFAGPLAPNRSIVRSLPFGPATDRQ